MGPRDFLGEECLLEDSRRTSTATSLEPATLFGIEKHAMLQSLHDEPMLAEQFTACLLARSVRLEEDLCGQLFNHSERRLALLLLKFSRFPPHKRLPDTKVSNFTHTMLADIVGTTRPTINFFMNKFRRLGLIDYQEGGGDITVMAEALTDSILRDEFKTRTRPSFLCEQQETNIMNEIQAEITSARLNQDKEWGGAEHDDAHEPEKWCAFIRHQLRFADRAVCSLATDEISGGEEQALVDNYRARLIKIAAVAIAATESLDRIMKREPDHPIRKQNSDSVSV